MSKLAVIIIVAAMSGAAGYGIADRAILTPAALDMPGADLAGPRPDAATALPERAPVPSAAPDREPSPADVLQYGQSYGTVCTTSQGSCSVPRQPLNSVCQCGGAVGRVTR